MKKTIRTLLELQALRSLNARHGISEVLLELPGPFDEIRKLEVEINKSLKACGCEIGAMLVAIGLLALVFFSVLTPTHINWASSKTIFGTAGYLGILALLGKIIGLAIANRRLQLAIDLLEHSISQGATRQ